MLKTTLVLVLALTNAILVTAEWKNALTPTGKSKKVILVRDGKLDYKIVGAQAGKATELLRDGLTLLTKTDCNTKAAHSISLDKKSRTDLGIDGYAIKVKDNGDIILYGSCDNGLLNAAIALLEEDMGWRYYQKYRKAQSPSGKITKANIVPRSYIPYFFQRSVWSEWARLCPDWITANKIRHGKFPKGLFCHTFARLIPPGKYLKSHPEFFALRGKIRVGGQKDGQLCMTNAQLRKTLKAKVIKVIEDCPAIDFFALSQNDNDAYCRCPECMALIKQDNGNPSGALMRFVNDIASEVAVKYPRIKIITEAYRYSLHPGKIPAAKNVTVRIALNNRISSYPFFFVSETDDAKLFEQWPRKASELMVWDYVTNFGHFLLPRTDLPVIEHNLRFYRDNGVKGVMLQDNHRTCIGTLAPMRAWVYAKLLWNPDLSVEALCRDYINGFWDKEIAPYMLAYNQLLIDQWLDFHKNNKPGAAFVFSDDFYAKATAILKQAIAAARNNPEQLKQLELEQLTLDYYLLHQGLRSEKEVATYQEVLKDFSTKLKKLKIQEKFLTENTNNTVLDEFADNIKLISYTKNVPASHIVLSATRNIYITRGATVDPQSLVGRSMRQDATGAWDIQWRLENFSRLIPGRYKVMIRARALKNPHAKNNHGTLVGVYNRAGKHYPLRYSIKAGQLAENEYRWIDCGTFELTPDPIYLFTSTAKDGAFKTFYADAVEFIPVH